MVLPTGKIRWPEIINIPKLKDYLTELDERNMVPEVLKEVILQSKVEFNYEDEE